jgi:hypothetical protein
MRVQLIRIGMHYLRARCALAKAVAAGSSSSRLYLAAAKRDAHRIERERMPWGDALARLIHAGVATGRGHWPEAAAQLNAAIAGLEASDMRYLAAIARRRLGELTGGDQGPALINEVNSWMRVQKVRNPDRFAATFLPDLRC